MRLASRRKTDSTTALTTTDLLSCPARASGCTRRSENPRTEQPTAPHQSAVRMVVQFLAGALPGGALVAVLRPALAAALLTNGELQRQHRGRWLGPPIRLSTSANASPFDSFYIASFTVQ